jgi:hypothetical protein
MCTCAAGFVGVLVVAMISATFVEVGEGGLTGGVAAVLVLVEVRLEVIQKRGRFSTFSEVEDCGQKEDANESKGNDSNKELEVRQVGLHGDLLNSQRRLNGNDPDAKR